MKYRRLDIENFGPFLGSHSLDLSSDDSRNIIIIYGQNGAGKSHLFRAMHFALYGYVNEDGENLKPESLANEIVVSEAPVFNMSVALDVEAEDDSFSVKRQIEFESFDKFANEKSAHKSLMQGGIALPGAQIDSFIERRLPSSVSKFFLFDAELLRRFESDLRFSSGRTLVRENINAILGVPAFQHAQSALNLLGEESDKAVATKAKARKEVSQAGQALEVLNAQKVEAVSDLNGIKDRLNEIAVEKGNIDSRLREFGDRERAIGEREATERTLTLENERIGELLDQVREISEDQWFLPLWQKISDGKRTALDIQSAVSARQEAASRYRWLGEMAQTSLDDGNCALCGQACSEHDLSTIESRLREAITADFEVSEDEQAHLDLLTKLKFTAAGESTFSRLIDLGKDLTTARLNVYALNRDISRLSLEIGDHGGEISTLNAQRDELLGEEANFTLYREQAELLLADVEKNIGEKRKLIRKEVDDSVDNERSRLIDDVKEVFDEALDAFQDRMREEVQERASGVFQRLISQKEMDSIRIANDFTLTVLDSQGEPAPRLSSGQQQVRALSLIAGLFECGVRGAPLVLDTPFARLDPEHLTNILTWISGLDRQVILLVQSNEFDIERDRPILENRIAREYTLVPERLRETRIEEGRPAPGRRW